MKKLIGFIFATFLLASNANAGTLTLTGSFDNSSSIQLFDLSFPTGTTGSITTQTAGFDPVLSLFASDGASLIAVNDDYNFPFSLDAQITGSLLAGNYILALTSGFYPSNIFDTFSGNSQTDLNWTVIFTGADDAIISARNSLTSAVPVPAAAWLLASTLLGFAGLKRKLV